MSQEVPEFLPGLPEPEFLMRDEVKRPVKIRNVRAAKHHGKVSAIYPVLFLLKVFLDPVVELRAGQGVGDRDADLIRLAILHHLEGPCNILTGFAGVTVLKKETDADTAFVQQRGRTVDLLDAGPFLHRIEDFL